MVAETFRLCVRLRLSRTQELLTKIHTICQEIRDIKKAGEPNNINQTNLSKISRRPDKGNPALLDKCVEDALHDVYCPDSKPNHYCRSDNNDKSPHCEESPSTSTPAPTPSPPSPPCTTPPSPSTSDSSSSELLESSIRAGMSGETGDDGVRSSETGNDWNPSPKYKSGEETEEDKVEEDPDPDPSLGTGTSMTRSKGPCPFRRVYLPNW